MAGNKLRRFLLAVAFATMAFILSCSDDSGNSNVGICGGKEYDITVYSCERGELVGSCRGVSYYPAYEYCENGVVKDGAEISVPNSPGGSGNIVNGANEAWVRCEHNQYCQGFIFYSDGRFQLIDQPPQTYDDVWYIIDDGTYTMSGNTIILNYDYGETEQITYSISGNTNTITVPGEGSYTYTRRTGITDIYDGVEPAHPASSSSGGSGNQFNPNIQYTQFTDSRDGKTYKSVVIGTQTWMAENLNYNAEGSRCYGEGRPVYDYETGASITLTDSEIQANCAKYGRFYSWSVAMAACPDGWHLPSDAEWATLIDYVGDYAGTKLKSAIGWNDYEGKSGNGTDDYGFSALPGGVYESYSTGRYSFTNAGSFGLWWSANESDRGICGAASCASRWYMSYKIEDATQGSREQDGVITVRCLQGYPEPPKPSSSSSVPSSNSSMSSSSLVYSYSSSVPSSSSSASSPGLATPTKTIFVDSRDGTSYNKVTIGTQTWMAENLNYDPGTGNSACYDNQPSNCNEYGRLYNWLTAMNLPSTCYETSNCPSQIQSPHKGICPSGWHIPSNADWDRLLRYVDGTSGTESPYYSNTAGKYLKASTGWNPYSGIENLDTYGFGALPGGSALSVDWFNDAGTYGNWWTASEIEDNGFFENNYNAYGRYIGAGNEDAGVTNYVKAQLLSVRCLQD